MNTSASSFTMDPPGKNNHEYDDLGLDNLLTCSTRLPSDDDEDERYVPESLASFVHAFDAALEEAKQNFFDTIASPRPARIEEEDWNRTPLPNPAHPITVSAAKRELQIFTIPRPPSVASESSTPATSKHPHLEELTISPIVASPQTRQKLFDSSPAKEIKKDSSEAIASKGSSSPTWTGMSAASKRRTQFIKARKASKRATPEPTVKRDETSSLSAIKSSSPLLRSRMMKGSIASRAKKQEEQRDEENSSEPKALSMDPPGANTIDNNGTAQIPAAPSSGGGMTMGDSLTSDDDDDVIQEPIAKTTPCENNVESPTDNSLINQTEEYPAATLFGKHVEETMGDSPAIDNDERIQTLVAEGTPTDMDSTIEIRIAMPTPTDMNDAMSDSLTRDAVARTETSSAKATSFKVDLDIRMGSAPMTDDVATMQSSAAKKTSSSKAESRLKDETKRVSLIKRPLSGKTETITRVNSSTSSAKQVPVGKRVSPEKIELRAVNPSPSAVRKTHTLAAKLSPPRKSGTSTRVDSTTSDNVTTQAPDAKSAPSVKVIRSLRVENRDKENRSTTVSNRIKKPTLDEKIAAARERARLRSLEKEALIAERIAWKSKLSNTVSVQLADKRRVRRPVMKVAPVPSRTRLAKPKVTIPQSPNFATNYKLGTRKPAPPASSQVSLAQSTDVLRNNLRSQESVTHIRRAGLTIPKTPKFATNSRFKPRFITPGARTGIVTLAQSNDVLRKGLRAMTAPVSKRPNGLTIPKSPKFQTISKRALPQSAAEKDAEIMSYYQSNPFKAGPIITELPRGKTKVNLPRPSASAVSSVRVGRRVPIAARPPPATTKEDTENTQFKFQARPMPDFFRHSTSIIKATSKKPQTYPIPFRLSPCSTSPEKIRFRSEEVNETHFRARPIPKSTYEYQPPPKTPPRVTNDAKAPDLATAKRTVKHDAIVQLSRARAEALSAGKAVLQDARKREQHKEALKKAELVSHRTLLNLENIKPFDLQSTKRHENYIKQREEKKRQDEEERLKQMEFHARSFHPSPAPSPIHSPRTPTQPEPFNISGMDSVEAEQGVAREKLRRKEEEKKSREQISPFKARPVPSSTYTSPSSLASRTSPQVSFRACRTPTRASPVQCSYYNDSPSDLSDSRDVNDDEIEIEFTESDARDTEIDHFFTNLMKAESRR